MSNKELIERVIHINDRKAAVEWISDAMSALEAADKRIAELEAERDERPSAADYGELNERFNAVEHKLSVAREALKSAYNTATDHDDREPFDWAVYCEMLYQTLAQIGEK